MNKFQKKDLKKLLQFSQQKIDRTIEETRNINDLKFWQSFKNYKNRRVKKMYAEQEANEVRREESEADSLIEKI